MEMSTVYFMVALACATTIVAVLLVSTKDKGEIKAEPLLHRCPRCSTSVEFAAEECTNCAALLLESSSTTTKKRKRKKRPHPVHKNGKSNFAVWAALLVILAVIEAGVLVTKYSDKNDGSTLSVGGAKSSETDAHSAGLSPADHIRFAFTDPNGKNQDDIPLLIAAIERNNLDEAEKLVAKGADVNIVDKYNRTPLMVAADKEIVGAIKLLLRGRAQVNQRTNMQNDTCYQTALSNAIDRDFEEGINLLKASGAREYEQVGLEDIGLSGVSIELPYTYGRKERSVRKLPPYEELRARITTAGSIAQQVENGPLSYAGAGQGWFDRSLAQIRDAAPTVTQSCPYFSYQDHYFTVGRGVNGTDFARLLRDFGTPVEADHIETKSGTLEYLHYVEKNTHVNEFAGTRTDTHHLIVSNPSDSTNTIEIVYNIINQPDGSSTSDSNEALSQALKCINSIEGL